MQGIEETRRLNLLNLIAGHCGQQQLADAADKSPAQISQWVNRSPDSKTGKPRVMGSRAARDFEKALGLPAWWMDTPHNNGAAVPVPPDATPPGYVRFSLLEGFVAAGEEGYAPDYPEVVSHVDVAETWAQQNIRAPLDAVRVITARGDSMTGDINDGDVLFVDSRVQHFDSDAVYVMNWQGRPLVKRLQLRRDGTLMIRSTNPAYEPEIVPPGEIDRLHISGRVLAAWGFKRF